MDDIEFTSPDTPTQYPSQNTNSALSCASDDDGPMNSMGTSASKDDPGGGDDEATATRNRPDEDDGAGTDGGTPAMPMTDGGVLASLGPPTSSQSQGSATSSVHKRGAGSSRSIGTAGQEDKLGTSDRENVDDDDETPSM